jgi:hypothetical protein
MRQRERERETERETERESEKTEVSEYMQHPNELLIPSKQREI